MDNLAKPTNRALFLVSVAVTGAFAGAAVWLFFFAMEHGIDDLIVTSDMAEREAKMIELGDAFIAFPGGTGTLEEIAEVMSAVSLGHLSAPCILYNLDGYYNDLKALLGHMIDKGLSSLKRQHGIYFADDLREIVSIING